MNLLDKDSNLKYSNLQNLGVIGQEIEISKKINGFSKLTFKLHNTDDIVFNDVNETDLIEIEDDLYQIVDIKEDIIDKSKDVVCSQILDETRKLYWENDFLVINPTDWSSNTKIFQGLFYKYDNKTYICTTTHISEISFNESYFEDVSHLEDNFMTDTNPQEVLEKIFNGTNWTVQTCDNFTHTDFTIQRGSLYQNIQNILKVWGGELDVKGRNISLKKRIGKDVQEEFRKYYNINTLEVSTNTDKIINKLFLYGKDGLTIESIHPQKYIEDLTSINQYGEKTGEILLKDIDDPDFLKYRGEEELDKLKNPFKSLNLKVIKFSSESFDIGDTVLLDIDNKDDGEYRIMSISYNPLNNKINDISLNNKELDIVSFLSDMIDDYKKRDDTIEDNLLDNVLNNKKFIDKVLDVSQFGTMSVEVLHAQNAWITNLFVDKLETNFWGKDIRNQDLQTLKNSGVLEVDRNYIEISDNHINFVTETLLLQEEEELLIPNPDLNIKNMVNVYYTAILENEDAYMFYTLTNPTVFVPDMDPENAEMFKVKCFKVKEVGGVKRQQKKMVLRFTDTGELHPELQIGAGSSSLNPDSLQDKFLMFKGSTYMNMIYYNQNEEISGIQMSQEKTTVRNARPHVGQGGHLSNIWYNTIPPSNSIGYNGDIYIKLKE